MGLELSQLYRVLNGPPKSAARIDYLPTVVADYLGSKMGAVYLSGDSLRHILAKHQGSMTLEQALLAGC